MKILKSEKQNRINKRNSIDESINLILNINESMTRKIKSTSSTDIENKIDDEIDPNTVDLGTSVRWCHCNLGASSPFEGGALFPWNFTIPYDTKSKISPYNQWHKDYKLNYPDKKGDAASFYSKGKYRTPTVKDFEELLRYCDTQILNSNGVKGILFLTKKTIPNLFSCQVLSQLKINLFLRMWNGSDIGHPKKENTKEMKEQNLMHIVGEIFEEQIILLQTP